MEVEVGVSVGRVARVEDPETDPVPGLEMGRAVGEGLARQLCAGEGDCDRAVPCGLRQRLFETLGGGLGDEGDRGAVRRGRAVVGQDRGLVAAEEGVRGELDAPARAAASVRQAEARGDGAAAPRERVDADPGRVLGGGDGLVPAALAEGEQQGGVGDAGAVVGAGDEVAAMPERRDGDVEGGGAAAARVLQELGEGVVLGRVEEPGDAVDRAVGDPGADRGGHVGVHGILVVGWNGNRPGPPKRVRKRRGGDAGGGPARVRCGGGTRGCRTRRPSRHGRWRGRRAAPGPGPGACPGRSLPRDRPRPPPRRLPPPAARSRRWRR